MEFSKEVAITEAGDGEICLPGHLMVPEGASGVVLFAHGSGSSRFSPRNQKVAQALNDAGLGTLLFDLLNPEESENRDYVFDIPLLASRLMLATRWVTHQAPARGLPIGYFGASTGAGAALYAAAEFGDEVSAVVSRGGRPDLAMDRLSTVSAATLLIVGGFDEPVIEMNQEALKLIRRGEMVIIPGATHLFEEPGALDAVARNAILWFKEHFAVSRAAA